MPLSSVLIVGAGPAGLSLAQYLKTHGIPYHIVEKSNGDRLQGYSVSLHFALEYLTKAMGKEKMDSIVEKTSVNYRDETAFATVDHLGNVVMKSNGTPTLIGYGIRANRSRLRKFLLDGIDIEMDVDATGVVFTGNGPVLKTNKGDMSADVIVGADGLHSAVRTSIIGDKVEELSIVNLSASREISAEEHAEFIKYSPTHAMMYGEKKDGHDGVVNLFYSVSDISPDKKRVNVRWILSWDKTSIYKDIPDTQEGLRDLANEMAQGYTDPFKSLVQNTDPSEKYWLGMICQYMPDPSWNGKEQVTLVGDAMHAMTPYRGEGLNHAILDIVKLGEQLVKAHHGEQTVGEAIAMYEEEAIARGRKAVQASFEMAASVHRGFSWPFVVIARSISFMLNFTQNIPFLELFFPKTH
jgi:2-polyprenyl-6-methoxyphenol hydroxylase-like FAD-dependent oxidoreductase